MCEYGVAEGIDLNPLKIEQVQAEGYREVKWIVDDAEIIADMTK